MSSDDRVAFMFALGLGIILGAVMVPLLAWVINVPAWMAMITPVGAAIVLMVTEGYRYKKEIRSE